MASLIYTDRQNLLKSLEAGIIRIPQNLKDVLNLFSINSGERIFFYDFENRKIYGPAISLKSEVREEKNPRQGPYNGFGNVRSHYRYLTMEVDCSAVQKKGVPAAILHLETDTIRFHLTEKEERILLDKIVQLNAPPVPIILHVSAIGLEVKVSIVEIEKGTSISRYSFRINQSFNAILERKKRVAERELIALRREEFLVNLREIGLLVYETFFSRVNCERFFLNGGYRIDFDCDGGVEMVPFEVTYRECFLFEKNIIAFRSSEEDRKQKTAHISRVLLITDAESGHSGLTREGLFLFDLFANHGVEVDLCCRNLTRDMLAEQFLGYDIVHFTGRSAQRGSSTAWQLGKSLFSAEDIPICSRKMAGGSTNREKHPEAPRVPFLVFSNSCGVSPRFGLKFLEAGVSNVVCTRWRIPLGSLMPFLSLFYTQLLQGEEIGYSFSRALAYSYANGRVVPLAFFLLGESSLVYER